MPLEIEKCICGESKSAWAAACKACWRLVPKVKRAAFFDALPGSQAKRNALAGCLAAIRLDPRFLLRAQPARNRQPNERKDDSTSSAPQNERKF